MIEKINKGLRYVALLRGINVGGKNIIKMNDLKKCFTQNGFDNVLTYIQSGNVIFNSTETQTEKLESEIENVLSKAFKYNSKVLVRSYPQIKKVLSQVPPEWKTRNDLRCYVAFIKEPLTPRKALKEVNIKEGIDSVKAGIGVLYLTTLLSGLTKSGINKIASKKIYQDITIRNYNTTQKIASLMENSSNK